MLDERPGQRLVDSDRGCPLALGAGIAADERERIELEPNAARTMYLGMDGTGVPMRKSETEGRAGKQPDGSARTLEMKLAVVWTAETTDEEGQRKADAMSTSYNAAIETARMGGGGQTAFSVRTACRARGPPPRILRC